MKVIGGDIGGTKTVLGLFTVAGAALRLEAEQTFHAVRDSVETWQAIWPDAHHVTIESGHLMLEEAPDKVGRAIFS